MLKTKAAPLTVSVCYIEVSIPDSTWNDGIRGRLAHNDLHVTVQIPLSRSTRLTEGVRRRNSG